MLKGIGDDFADVLVADFSEQLLNAVRSSRDVRVSAGNVVRQFSYYRSHLGGHVVRVSIS